MILENYRYHQTQKKLCERGAALIAVLFAVTILSILGMIFLVTAGMESRMASNAFSTESTLGAAEAAIHVKVIQMSQNPVSPNTTAIPNTGLSPNFSFQSGNPAVSPGPSCQMPPGEDLNGPFTCVSYFITGTGLGPQNSVQRVEVNAGLLTPKSSS